jgi:hypothetical protein
MSDTHVYRKVKMHINNAFGGQLISVSLSQKDSPVAWSSGPAFTNSDGIKVETNTGRGVPVFALTIKAEYFSLNLSPLSEHIAFTVDLYLVAQAGIQAFGVRHSSDNGPSVHISIGDSHPEEVSRKFVDFSWSS